MRIKQLSLFVENKSGSLHQVCKVLAEHHISIRTLSLADTEQFGILRLLVKEWEDAKKVLEDAGFIVRITDVFAIPVEDRPGGLAELLEILDRGGMNVEYMYAFTFGRHNRAVIVFRFEDPDKACKVLKENKIDVIKTVDLFD
ncbi:MAG: ACT domain-containing protein [Victivallales bacterium]|nr:ACT domain-containing protein [Victivallales bacterium]